MPVPPEAWEVSYDKPLYIGESQFYLCSVRKQRGKFGDIKDVIYEAVDEYGGHIELSYRLFDKVSETHGN